MFHMVLHQSLWTKLQDVYQTDINITPSDTTIPVSDVPFNKRAIQVLAEKRFNFQIHRPTRGFKGVQN